MRRPGEGEGPDTDLDLDLADPEGSEEEEQDDPLAGLTEEQRAAVEVRAQAIAAQNRQALETEFNEHKTKHSRRMTTAREALREQFGLDIDDEGKPVYRDPQKLTQAAIQLGGRPATQTQDANPLAEQIDAFNDDPDTIEAKIRHRAEQIADERFSKRFGELEERLARAEGAAYRPINQGIPNLAREALESRGMGHLADHPEFAEMVTQAAQQAYKNTPDALSDPDAIAAAALFVVPLLERSLPDDVRARAAEARKGQDPAALAAEARRRALAQTGVSRHTPARGQAFTDEDIEAAEALRQEFPESAGRMTPQMAQVLGSEQISIDDWRRAQRKTAGARR